MEKVMTVETAVRNIGKEMSRMKKYQEKFGRKEGGRK